MTKCCIVCGEAKAPEAFAWYAAGRRRANTCKACKADNARAWDKAHPERKKARHLRANYGLTLSAWQRLLEKQGWCCAVCKLADRGTLHVDHDHRTGKVRGLLCGGCNTGGGLTDNVALLRAKVDYLQAPPAADIPCSMARSQRYEVVPLAVWTQLSLPL